MAAYVGRILVAERNIDRGAHRAHLLGGRDERVAILHGLAQRRAELRMQNGRSVLELARLPDNGCLAVAFRLPRTNAQGLDALATEQVAQLFAYGDEFVERVDIASRVRILDHRHGERTSRGRLNGLAHLDARFFDLNDQL